MSFVRVKDLLEMGKKNNACVLAFDAADGNMIKSVIKGAKAGYGNALSRNEKYYAVWSIR